MNARKRNILSLFLTIFVVYLALSIGSVTAISVGLARTDALGSSPDIGSDLQFQAVIDLHATDVIGIDYISLWFENTTQCKYNVSSGAALSGNPTICGDFTITSITNNAVATLSSGYGYGFGYGNVFGDSNISWAGGYSYNAGYGFDTYTTTVVSGDGEIIVNFKLDTDDFAAGDYTLRAGVSGLENATEKFTYYSDELTFTLAEPTAATTTSSSSGTSKSVATNPKQTKIFATVAAGEKIVFTPTILSANVNSFTESLAITEIVLVPGSTSNNVKLSVQAMTESVAADLVPIQQSKVYRYLQINVENVDSFAEPIQIAFKVSKAWLAEQSVDKNHIVLTRYTSDWDMLSTSISSEDDQFVYYVAQTPGLSYFAITTTTLLVEESTDVLPDDVVADTVDVQADADEPPVVVDGSEKRSSPFLTVIIILATLGLLYFFIRKRK